MQSYFVKKSFRNRYSAIKILKRIKIEKSVCKNIKSMSRMLRYIFFLRKSLFVIVLLPEFYNFAPDFKIR